MVFAKEQWTPIEAQVYRELRSGLAESWPNTGGLWLVMCSGGADSMALVTILSHLRPALGCDFQVLYCHHGPSSQTEQVEYREQAQALVRKWCEKHRVVFHSVQAEHFLKSEEDYRDFRKEAASKLQIKGGFERVVWGHQAQDFLETRMLRLIRGAGVHGLYEPMSLLRGSDLRPLLFLSRSEILEELKARDVEWLEDPSNQDESYLRNWLRHNWLPQLEKKCPGALSSFSRSLDLIFESQNEVWPEGLWVASGISRSTFLSLNEAQKRQALAFYLRQNGQMQFTHNQIKEVLRNLDISKLEHTFRAASVQWTLTKDLISANFQ
jgi:tRNA(Ile)-lysidine synthase